MKVVEEEYDTVEEHVTVYVCDRCGDEMDEEPEHTLHVNPRLESEPRSTDVRKKLKMRGKDPGFGAETPDRFIQEHSELNTYHGTQYTVRQEVDKSMEWCEGCVDEVFDTETVPRRSIFEMLLTIGVIFVIVILWVMIVL